ncbi:MAG: sulfatase-like hydrolase/transferase, partial [Mailhella sp.]|nr:sulfatase-like hydrolase/transferase [Mailhella sp.]
PCRRAMHTGRYTLPVAGWVPLSMEDTTIADLCWGRPIDTALIFDCPMYRQPKFGYTRGFDKVYFTHGHEMDHQFYGQDPLIHYDPKDFVSDSVVEAVRSVLGEAVIDTNYREIESYLRQMQFWKSDEDRYVAKTMKQAVKYLEQVDRNKQFYLWVDSFDPHEPWNSPSVYTDQKCPYDPEYEGKDDFLPVMGDVKGIYTERELTHIRALYAELVTVCDKWFGYFLDNVRRLGFEENTMVMMVSDHGEPMGNGEHGHGIMRKVRPWPYEELSHVPFIVRGPGMAAGKKISAFVSSVDVAPTVCDWLGIGVHPAMQGKSLLPLISGEVEKVRDFAISGYYNAGWAIYTEDWSYVHWPLKEKDTSAWHVDCRKNMNTATSSVGKSTGLSGSANSKDFDNTEDLLAGASEELKKHRASVTIDGEAQWTCTPGAAYITPEGDELYNRKEDPFQLNNVIDEYPEMAKRLLDTLKDTIIALQDS